MPVAVKQLTYQDLILHVIKQQLQANNKSLYFILPTVLNTDGKKPNVQTGCKLLHSVEIYEGVLRKAQRVVQSLLFSFQILCI